MPLASFEKGTEVKIQCAKCQARATVKVWPLSAVEGDFQHFCTSCKERVGHNLLEIVGAEKKIEAKIEPSRPDPLADLGDKKPAFDFSTDAGPSAKPGKASK